MTICVPKRPFEILYSVVSVFALWFWLPFTITIVILSIIWRYEILLFLILNIIFIGGWAVFWLEDNWCGQNFIKWCDKNER